MKVKQIKGPGKYFKCSYCFCNLNKNTWELDHVQPISKGGLNISTNISASCKKCNRMKGSLEIMDFINKCKLISKQFENSYILAPTLKK